MRWVGIAVVSKHIMHSVYASHRRRSLARLRFTRDRRWRDCGDSCGVGLRIVVNGVCVRHSPRVGNRFGG